MTDDACVYRIGFVEDHESVTLGLRAMLGLEVLVYTGADNAYLVRSAARAGVLGVVRKSEPAAAIVDATGERPRVDKLSPQSGPRRSTATRTCPMSD